MAPDRAVAVQARPEQEFFCFRVGDLRLGVPSENVLEVFRAGLLTPLPRTPSFIMGVTGHRGEVLPVVDLLRFLSKGEARIGPRTRLFIGITGSIVAGVVADTVLGLRRIPVADILPPPLGGDAAAEHLMGVVPGATPQDSINLLNFSKLLQTARQRAVAR
ncbi:chemotaxis protein CheW [Myxococcus sp. MISCRS1]|jgi:purine-binding chemotaxis protein CheW|uniref:chemotaxis protein CheW n=1 Tax=Myxococcus TaxID=32 RepID=UPI001145041A|nr:MULTISPECIES: chemotaxis protein CheW [Myxococcus]BDT34302.1 chemotaxis protein CheW [Myxococcus sp. MH1]MBZ4399512.1 chemotaxis protein CheW [Myxococcus sp. AS-1-15]MBZ4412207.1 chemotaxis protein CheW [Myxococcus sp. XM-1-1-1]MCK8502284.1 chemotaxis protein CheW [Myxococcus fulvus]MCY0995712.1 chemotaxis protein CheW [Myxococcus sp. MISCRS1]